MVSFNLETKHLVDELGFNEYGLSLKGRAGGLSCIKSNEKPIGFKSVGKQSDKLYMPKASNKELWSKINELPVLSFDEFNSAIDFKMHFKGLTHYRSYGFNHVGDLFLIDTGDSDYTPKSDMIEILESEYNKLKQIK